MQCSSKYPQWFGGCFPPAVFWGGWVLIWLGNCKISIRDALARRTCSLAMLTPFYICNHNQCADLTIRAAARVGVGCKADWWSVLEIHTSCHTSALCRLRPCMFVAIVRSIPLITKSGKKTRGWWRCDRRRVSCKSGIDFKYCFLGWFSKWCEATYFFSKMQRLTDEQYRSCKFFDWELLMRHFY